MAAAIEEDVYFSGGTVFLEDPDTGEWEEVALVQSLEVQVEMASEDVMDFSEGMQKIFASIVTKLDYTVKFKTKQVNAKTLAKTLLAEVETGVPNPLVDGVKGGYTTVTRLRLGKGKQYRGRFKFESEPVCGEYVTVLFDKIFLKSDSSLALITDKAAELDFSGKAGKGVGGGVGEMLRGERE